MWLPTSDAMVLRMLNAARTTSRDVVYDLGAGEGRIPIAAAREFGARAVGIEYDAELARLAERNAERAGVADRVTIIRGDIFAEDFSKATVVTLYLLPDLNFQLRPQLLQMKPGTRVVSHMWDMGEWEPDETFHSGASEGFLWVVPAQVAGRWTLREEDGSWWGDVTLTQRFQRVGGTLTLRGGTQPLLGAYVSGATLGFTFVDPFGAVRTLRAQVDGDALAGHVRFVSTASPITGRRSERPAPALAVAAPRRAIGAHARRLGQFGGRGPPAERRGRVAGAARGAGRVRSSSPGSWPLNVASGSARRRSATVCCSGVSAVYSALPASAMSSVAVRRLRATSASASSRCGAVVSIADTRPARRTSSSRLITRSRYVFHSASWCGRRLRSSSSWLSRMLTSSVTLAPAPRTRGSTGSPLPWAGRRPCRWRRRAAALAGHLRRRHRRDRKRHRHQHDPSSAACHARLHPSSSSNAVPPRSAGAIGTTRSAREMRERARSNRPECGRELRRRRASDRHCAGTITSRSTPDSAPHASPARPSIWRTLARVAVRRIARERLGHRVEPHDRIRAPVGEPHLVVRIDPHRVRARVAGQLPLAPACAPPDRRARRVPCSSS